MSGSHLFQVLVSLMFENDLEKFIFKKKPTPRCSPLGGGGNFFPDLVAGSSYFININHRSNLKSWNNSGWKEFMELISFHALIPCTEGHVQVCFKHLQGHEGG